MISRTGVFRRCMSSTCGKIIAQKPVFEANRYLHFIPRVGSDLMVNGKVDEKLVIVVGTAADSVNLLKGASPNSVGRLNIIARKVKGELLFSIFIANSRFYAYIEILLRHSSVYLPTLGHATSIYEELAWKITLQLFAFYLLISWINSKRD